jgi:hypothetical protein
MKKNYNIYVNTENEKYNVINIIKAAGATLTAVSGCGSGYYIQLDADENQVDKINRRLEVVNA